LAIEAEDYNVRVSVVCPGNIRTPMLDLKEPSWLTPAIPVEKAARCIVQGIARNRKIIVFPLRWRFVWWVDRLNPALLNPLRRVIVRRARRLKSSA
jgi:short-subunit dehydrogenase